MFSETFIHNNSTYRQSCHHEYKSKHRQSSAELHGGRFLEFAKSLPSTPAVTTDRKSRGGAIFAPAIPGENEFGVIIIIASYFIASRKEHLSDLTVRLTCMTASEAGRQADPLF